MLYNFTILNYFSFDIFLFVSSVTNVIFRESATVLVYDNEDMAKMAKKCKEIRRRVKCNSKILHDIMTIRHA